MTRGQKKNLMRTVRPALEFRINETMIEFERLRQAYHAAQIRGDEWGVRNTRHLTKAVIRRLRLDRYILEAAGPDHLNARGGISEYIRGSLLIRHHHRSAESRRDPRD